MVKLASQNAPRIQALIARMDALGDAARLRLLRLLERHELGVAELCDVLQMPQSSVSRHLKMLVETGWIYNRREGTSNLYRMSGDFDPAARRLWQVARDQTSDWPAVAQDQLRLARRLHQRKAASEAFFAGAAGQWDRLRSELYGSAFTHLAMLALLPPEFVVADLGCGTGHVTAMLAQHVKRVVGIDSSDAMLRAARKRTDDLPNVEIKRGRLESLPIDDDACDAALLVIVLTYVESPAAALSEMARILKPGGRAIVVDLLAHDREDFRRQMGQQSLGFDANDLKKLFKSAGLTPQRISPIPPAADAKGPALQLATAKKN